MLQTVINNLHKGTSNNISTIHHTDIKNKLVKGVVTGGVMALAGGILYGNAPVNIFGMTVTAMVPLAGSGFASSVITDYIHEAMPQNLPTPLQKLEDISSTAMGAVISGVSSVAIMKIGVGLPNENLIGAALLGGGSYVAGDYIQTKFLQDASGKLIF